MSSRFVYHHSDSPQLDQQANTVLLPCSSRMSTVSSTLSTSLTSLTSSTAQSQSETVTALPRWVLASNNLGKLSEFKRLFKAANLAVAVVAQGELAIDDAVEDGLSFVENAIIKARHASKLSGFPAISDDSGLCVPVLGNAPGIYSARYAGEHGNAANNNAKLLADLQPWRAANPSLPIQAYFVCVLAMLRHADDPLPIIAQGLWHGEILAAPLGDQGFGYDPLFWLPTLQQSAAQLDAQTKNTLSHRGQALQHLLAQLLD